MRTITTFVVYPSGYEGKRQRVTPLTTLPPTRAIARRSAIGLAVLIAGLTIVGMFLTSTSVALGARRWDQSVNSWLEDDRSEQFVRLAEWFSGMADTRPILAIMATITIVLAMRRRWQAMLLVPLAMLIEISTFLAVNYLVGRPRPDVSKIGPIPGTYSFPSGHVAATCVCCFGIAVLLYMFGHFDLSRVASAIAAAMTVMTAWGRVYLGMHHTLDVVLGVVMGVAALTIAATSLRLQLLPGGQPVTVPETVSV
jgi:undecaprenyl-diphosphatase